MRTTNYLTLSALVYGSIIAGCGSNDGGTSTGPSNSGGISAGGATNVGGASTGGGTKSTTGGANVGGNATGGAATGGANVGGNATGGAATGGAATGGANVGGNATGGKATGGANVGGNATGGLATGGANVGGNATGGAATGGANVGGNATGGKATGGANVGGNATGGTPPATGGTATGTGGGTGCAHAANILSDFESGTGTLFPVPTASTTGYWFSYKDTTNCSSSTLVPAPATDTGVAAALVSGAGGPHDTSNACNKYAMHSSITNCQTYSGFGAAMHPTGGGSTVNIAVDVSGYDGISFWAKAGSGTQGPLYMELVSKECVPSTAGGTAVSSITDQYNCHGKLFSSIPTTWTQYFVPFGATGPRWFPTLGSGTTTCNGTTLFCEAPQLVRSNFLSFQFALEDPFNNTGLLANYDVWIDDVALYKFTDTPADGGLSTWTQSGANAFPKNTTYTGCTKPTGADGKLLQNAYVNWKAKFVVSDHVISPEIDTGSPTVSEGMGYGMLLAVYMGDKPLFDALLGYWKAHGSAQSMLMNWKIGGTGGSGSATDADEDVAFALAMAVKQWGTSYQTDLTTILGQFLANDVDSGNYLKPGNSFGGQNETNPSYFAPAFYKYFATVADTGNAAKWNALTTNVYTQLANITGSNGLVPAWCTNNCQTRGDGGKYTDDTMYQYDSHRTPWRIGLDACWNNEAKAKTYLNAVVGFFAGLAGAQGGASTGISRIGDIYQSSGTVNSDSAYNSMSLIGCAGVGAMGSTATNAATFRDRAWQFLLEGQYTDNPIFKVGNSSTKAGYTYYNATVGLLTAMTMSGNFYQM